MRILLVGGSKSGKSMLAQELTRALSHGSRMYYWATMDPVDSEDEARITRHVSERAGWGFETVECGRDLLSFPALSEDSSVLFDSITALLANEMFTAEGMDETAAERAVNELSALSLSIENFVCVCDEVFHDGIDYSPMTECYRKGLAKICRELALEFDLVCEVVCGIPNIIKCVGSDAAKMIARFR